MSTRSLFPRLLFAAAVIGTGSQIAVNAVSFLQGTWNGPVGTGASIASALFAPFALAALLLPLAAAPLATRFFPERSGRTVSAAPASLIIWLLAETGMAVARASADLTPLGSPFLLHALMTSHAMVAGFLMREKQARP
jgi:hypothetical protein